jgi:hypothetical protein
MPYSTPSTQLGRVGASVGRLGTATSLNPSFTNRFSGMNTDRISRYQGREERRRGNWDILGIPTAVLWLEDMCAASALDPSQALECESAAVTDLWP